MATCSSAPATPPRTSADHRATCWRYGAHDPPASASTRRWADFTTAPVMYVTPSETSPREWKTEFMAPIDAAAAATDTGVPSTVAVVTQCRTSESTSRNATRDRTAGRSSRLRRRVTTAPPTAPRKNETSTTAAMAAPARSPPERSTTMRVEFPLMKDTK